MGVVLPLAPKTRGLTCDSRQVGVRKRVGRGRVNGEAVAKKIIKLFHPC